MNYTQYKDVSILCLKNYTQYMTFSGVAQLSTHHSSISISPEVITHSTPLIVHADLYSTFIHHITSCQSQLTICTWSCVTKQIHLCSTMKHY